MARESFRVDLPVEPAPSQDANPKPADDPSDLSPPPQADLAREADALRDQPESGRVLAEHMAEAGYQPVVLFGNAASGKTTLILSLLSTIKTEAQLDAAMFLGQPILDTSKKYGAYLWEQASLFFGLKTQQFIEGTAQPRTNIDLPFFIPLVLRPSGKPEAKLAFMESNGEWYRPGQEEHRFFPPLRRQIEEFLQNYGGGILFIHLLPYTQRALYTTDAGANTDPSDLSEASLAVSGALQAYNAVRPDKRHDRHIMLVTKWDAHSPEGVDTIDALYDAPEEVEAFVSHRYSQAYITFRGLELDSGQTAMRGYCAGQISGNSVMRAAFDSDLKEAILQYPIGLWKWLYRNTLELDGQIPIDPFPRKRRTFLQKVGDLLNRII